MIALKHSNIARRSRLRTSRLSALLGVILAAAPAAAVVPSAGPTGTWINPSRSVEVVTRDCGTSLCGWVVWSTAGAQDDARAGGTPKLVGTELLQDYRRADTADWHGRVLIPDMRRSFDSRLRLVSANAIKVSGCVLGGLLCKSQVWTRVDPR